MKSKKQYRDSMLFTSIGYIGLLVTLVALILFSCSEFNKEVREGIQNDPRPANHLSNYLPPSFYKELDTLEHNLDSLDKRLDSLLILEQIVDSILEHREPEMVYYDTLDINGDCGGSDEYKMWITVEGDTIWE
jgi:hypothetical protein